MSNYDDDYVPGGGTATAEADEQPAKQTSPPAARKIVRGGWGNAEKRKAASSPFPQRLAPDAEGVVVKFLEEGPYTSYQQHWINEVQNGSKAFTCIDGMEMGSCPLCDAGSRPSMQFRFNVAELSTDEEAVLKTYNVGVTVYDQLRELHTDPRQGPLQKHYWVIKRTKNGSKWVSTLFMQREDDLLDQGYKVPDKDHLDSFTLWTEAEVKIPSRTELLEIAAQYLDLE